MTHQTISFFKSGLRLVGYVVVWYAGLPFLKALGFIWTVGWATLFMSEALGILEEVGSWQTPRS